MESFEIHVLRQCRRLLPLEGCVWFSPFFLSLLAWLFQSMRIIRWFFSVPIRSKSTRKNTDTMRIVLNKIKRINVNIIYHRVNWLAAWFAFIIIFIRLRWWYTPYHRTRQHLIKIKWNKIQNRPWTVLTMPKL